MNEMEIWMRNAKIEKCDKCQKDFYRKWNSAKNNWSKINEVSFWTEGKDWREHKIICRSCLRDWKTNYREEWVNLMSLKKRGLYNSYLQFGLMDKKDR